MNCLKQRQRYEIRGKQRIQRKSLLTLPWSFDILFTSDSLLHDYNTQFTQYLRPNIKSSTTLKQIKYLANAHTFGTLQVQTSIFS